ncbi:hypothetical protein UlMin_006362 [Ulmus minor]
MLQDINDCNLPFGGKVVVFGGDFHQVFLVVPRGRKEEIININLIKLTENMRARLDPTFSEFLLCIGDGKQEKNNDDYIRLPSNMIIPYEDDNISLQKLIKVVFPNIEDYPKNLHFMVNKAILTPKNDYVDEINNLLMNLFSDNTEQSFQEEFLNTLTPNGIPPHELILKRNCPVILLQNLNASEGLCNGTRLICRDFQSNVIDAEIASRYYSEDRVFLPRIPFIPIENNKYPFPFPFKRTQFPIRPSFAMTINKVPGQTLDFVGIYLPQPIFSHGQLYVALSRAKKSDCVKILIKLTNLNKSCDAHTKNVVYKEILSLTN